MAKILYAKDQELCEGMLERRLMRKGGFECIRACNGEEAIKFACSEQPDLILIDTDLFNKDAWTTTQEIKAAKETQNIPIIVISQDSDDKNQAFAAGCDDFDTKPVELARLLEKINRLLSD